MKNWRTTLFGIVTAVGLGLANAQQVGVKLPDWASTIGVIAAVAGAAGTGAQAKDKNVTGGTVRQ
jgi:hypothetical protein